MAHKEYGVTEIIDILRRAQAKDSIRRIARATGVARNTIRNYLRLAAELGFSVTVPLRMPTDSSPTGLWCRRR